MHLPTLAALAISIPQPQPPSGINGPVIIGALLFVVSVVMLLGAIGMGRQKSTRANADRVGAQGLTIVVVVLALGIGVIGAWISGLIGAVTS